MEYNPPPFFKQGPSALARLLFFSLLAVALLLIDSRTNTLGVIRLWIGTALYPVQQAALVPRNSMEHGLSYFLDHNFALQENETLKKERVLAAQRSLVTKQLELENNRLRSLLGTRERVSVPSIVGEVLYDSRDSFTRKVVIDLGSEQNLRPGYPVMDELGVVGQVTRVFPRVSEVTLLTDKDQAIPVQILRTGVRSIAYGASGSTKTMGLLDLRFIGNGTDVTMGDILVTSGIDGLYPPGLPVAKVIQVDRKADTAFAKILCEPLAGISSSKHVLVLFKDMDKPERPEPEPEEKPTKGKKTMGPKPAKAEAKP